jgi:hypothetical protein
MTDHSSFSGRLRIVATLLLLASMAAPLSKCTYAVDDAGRPAAVSGMPEVGVVTQYRVAVAEFITDPRGEWLLLACFVWPLPILVLRRRGPGPWVQRALLVLEPVCLGGAAAYLHFRMTFFATPAIGGWAALAAHLMYGLGWLADALSLIRRLVRRWRSPVEPDG